MRSKANLIKLQRQRAARPRWIEAYVKKALDKPDDFMIMLNGATLFVALMWVGPSYWFVKVDNGKVFKSVYYPSYAAAERQWIMKTIQWNGEIR